MKKIFSLLVVLSLFLVAACSLPSPNDVGMDQEDSEVEESDDSALAGQAVAKGSAKPGLKAAPKTQAANPCQGKADGFTLDQCPTRTGRQRYCKEGKLFTLSCSPGCYYPDSDPVPDDRIPNYRVAINESGYFNCAQNTANNGSIAKCHQYQNRAACTMTYDDFDLTDQY